MTRVGPTGFFIFSNFSPTSGYKNPISTVLMRGFKQLI